MRRIDDKLVWEIEQNVIEFLTENIPAHCVFHTLRHTLDVEKNVIIIGEYDRISPEEINLARITALFHDVGYVYIYNGHEAESVRYAEEFLRSKQVEEPIIQHVADCIMATEIPQHPKDKIAGILCDADLMHLTYDNYFEQIEDMRVEWNNLGKKFYTPLDFHLNSIRFFEGHHYYSAYGTEVLKPKKEKTLQLIKDLVVKIS